MKKQGLNPEVVFQNVTPSRNTRAKDRSTDVLIQRRPPPPTPKQPARGTRVLIKRETQASMSAPRPPPPPHNRPSIDFDADSSDDEDFNVSALFRDARAPSSKRLRHKDFSMRASGAEYDNTVSGDVGVSGDIPIRRMSSGAIRTRPTKGSRGTKPAPPPPSYDAPGSPTRRTTAMPRNTSATNGFTRGDSSRQLQDPRGNKRNKPSFAQIPVPGVPEGFEPVDDDEVEVDLTKYRKMLKTGLPEGAIINALVRDGLDPGLFDKLSGSPAPSKTVSAPNIRQPPKKTIEKTNTTGNINAPKGLGEKHAMLNNLFGLKPADPAPKKEVSKPKGLGEKHAMLNNLFGLKPADEKPKASPKPRQTSTEQSGGAAPKQTKISSKFAGMHALLAKQMGGGGGGGGGTAKAEVKVDTEKAKAVAAKFASNKNKDLKAVVPGSPEYEKYKRMQKNKLPEGAIRNCLERDGFDPDSFFNGGASSPAPRATKANPMNALVVPKSQQRNTQMPAQKQNAARNTQVKNQNTPQHQQNGQYQQNRQQQNGQYQNNQRSQSQHNMQAHPSQRNMQNQRQASQHNVRGYASQTQMYYDPSYVQGQYHDPRATGYVGKYLPEPQISGSRVNDAWSIEWSQEYKRPYYFNRYTGESTWDPPADM